MNGEEKELQIFAQIDQSDIIWEKERNPGKPGIASFPLVVFLSPFLLTCESSQVGPYF